MVSNPQEKIHHLDIVIDTKRDFHQNHQTEKVNTNINTHHHLQDINIENSPDDHGHGPNLMSKINTDHLHLLHKDTEKGDLSGMDIGISGLEKIDRKDGHIHQL